MPLPEEGETPGPAQLQHCRNDLREWEHQQVCGFFHTCVLLGSVLAEGDPRASQLAAPRHTPRDGDCS